MVTTTASKLARTETYILAGGRGERLHPLTASRPKPSVSFGGMFRIIDFTLSNCFHSGLRRVSLLTQYRHEALHRYIRGGWSDLWQRYGPDRFPLTCLPPAVGKRYRGTADAVFRNLELLDTESEHVLILSGDHVYQMNYGPLLRQHMEMRADLTIACVEHPVEEASNFGVIRALDDLRITDFYEKPSNPSPMADNPSMALVNMGVYVFRKEILEDCLRHFCGEGRGFDFGHNVIPSLISAARVHAYNFRDPVRKRPYYWRDIGTIDSYFKANMDLLSADAPFDPHANGAWPSQPTRHPFLNRSSNGVSPECAHLHATCRATRTIISPGVRIESGATVHESVLMPRVQIGKGARLRRTIVEEGIFIPAGFEAGFDLDHDRLHHKVTDDGVVVISKTFERTKPKVVHFKIPNLIKHQEPQRATA